MKNINGPLKVGIGGPVGAGKTSLTAELCKFLSKKISMAVISNDIYTKEDAEFLMKYTYHGEELNELALSLCPSKERKIESVEMGNAFRKVLADSWDFNIKENTAYPIAVAKAAKHFDIPLNLTIVSYLQSFVSNLINVCIKHIPIGQKIGQDCIIKTYELIREIEKENQNLNLEDLGGICFNSDIYSIKHENLKTRIYKT